MSSCHTIIDCLLFFSLPYASLQLLPRRISLSLCSFSLTSLFSFPLCFVVFSLSLSSGFLFTFSFFSFFFLHSFFFYLKPLSLYNRIFSFFKFLFTLSSVSFFVFSSFFKKFSIFDFNSFPFTFLSLPPRLSLSL